MKKHKELFLQFLSLILSIEPRARIEKSLRTVSRLFSEYTMDGLEGCFLKHSFRGHVSANRQQVRPPSFVAGTIARDAHALIWCFYPVLHTLRVESSFSFQ